mgnify:CR=1 FL=1
MEPSPGVLRATLDFVARVWNKAGADDIFFLALPLFHIFGLNVTLGLLVMNGATGVVLDRFEPANEHEKKALELLRAWDRTTEEDSVGASIAMTTSRPSKVERTTEPWRAARSERTRR